MSWWLLSEYTFAAAFLLLWLGFVICAVVLMIQYFKVWSPFENSLSNQSHEMSFAMTHAGRILRTHWIGRVANVLLALGTFALILSGCLALSAVIAAKNG